jgi:hypothetical protein
MLSANLDMTTFVGLVALRLLLALSPIPAYLTDNHQLTSPLTSYTRRTIHFVVAQAQLAKFFTAPSERRRFSIPK